MSNANTSIFDKKIDFGSLKLDIDKLGIDKLKIVTIRLNNLKTDACKFYITKLRH